MQLAQSYLQGQASPFDGVLEAYGQGQVLRENKDLLQAKQAEQARKIAAQQALETIDWNDKSAIAKTVAQFPEYTKGAKDYYDALEQKEQQSMLYDMSTSISALSSDRPDIAVQNMRDKASAYRDAGNEEKAEEYSQMAEWMAREPKAAQRALLMHYAVLSPEKSGANLKAYGEAISPQRKEVDSGDAIYNYQIDPVTGEVGGAEWIVDKSATPDNVLDNKTSIANTTQTNMVSEGNNIRTNQTSADNNIRTNTVSEGNNIRTNQTSRDNNQESNETSRYNAGVASDDRRLKLNQDGKIEWAKISQAQQKIDNPATSRKQIPPSAMKKMGELQESLVSNAQTMKENSKWVNKLSTGELKLGAGNNFGNNFAARTGVKMVGSNPEDYAEFSAYIKDLANKALRLNAGVQTDADYKRQLEAIIAGDSMPKDNAIAMGLLNRMQKDFDSQNRGIYQNLANYKKEYAGVSLPAYGQGGGKNSSGNKPSGQGSSIIGGILGGG